MFTKINVKSTKVKQLTWNLLFDIVILVWWSRSESLSTSYSDTKTDLNNSKFYFGRYALSFDNKAKFKIDQI